MACCPDLESPFFSENEKSHGGLWDTGGHISLTRWWRDKHMGPSPGRHTACYRTRTHSARSPPWFAPFWILSTFPQFHRVPLRALSPSWGHVRSGLWQSFVTTFTARLFFAMLRKKKKKLNEKRTSLVSCRLKQHGGNQQEFFSDNLVFFDVFQNCYAHYFFFLLDHIFWILLTALKNASIILILLFLKIKCL